MSEDLKTLIAVLFMTVVMFAAGVALGRLSVHTYVPQKVLKQVWLDKLDGACAKADVEGTNRCSALIAYGDEKMAPQMTGPWSSAMSVLAVHENGEISYMRKPGLVRRGYLNPYKVHKVIVQNDDLSVQLRNQNK